MSNGTISYTFLSGNSVPMTLRKDGRYTARQQAAILQDTEARLAAVRETLSDYAVAYADGCSEAVAERWNALHDEETALQQTHLDVTHNFPHVEVGTSAWLAANNID